MKLPCADVVIVGGGSSGAVLAARLSEDHKRSVVLIEAGPDPGPSLGNWPCSLLDGAGDWSSTHEWGFWNLASREREAYPLVCGRVIGGSSSINAGGFNWPMRADIDEWAALGNNNWSFDRIEPYLRQVESDPDGHQDRHGQHGPMPVFRSKAELTPFFEAFALAACGSGFDWLADINDPGAAPGIARRARNTRDGVRWNASLAYLAPARARPNLKVMSDTFVTRIVVERGPALAVEVDGSDGVVQVPAGQVVLAAGAYNSPALLLRSGIGSASDLERHAIGVCADLPGVGAGLRDHPVLTTRVVLSEPFGRDAGRLHDEKRLIPWQVLLRDGVHRDDGFDLQLAASGEIPVEDGWESVIRVELMKPRSTGRVTLRAGAPHGPPWIDSGFLSDPAGDDVADLAEGFRRLRRLLRKTPLAAAVSRERSPVPPETEAGFKTYARANAYSYHHPCGTCRMGPAEDRMSVVDQRGAVHGIHGLYVADASIFPSIPRTPTAHTVMAVAERLSGIIGARDLQGLPASLGRRAGQV